MSGCMQDCCGFNSENICKNVATQYADISVPISLKPYSRVGEFKTECCGEPQVSYCKSQNGNSCEILITQTVCVRIPLEFGTCTSIGETSFSCKNNFQNKPCSY
ncbi:MAG: hypothetical protein RR540_01570 [Oscillospiraceae bacterium]